MAEKQRLIEDHNMQLKEELKRRHKAKKAADSSSPTRPDSRQSHIKKKEEADLGFVPHLIKTQPASFSPTGGSPLHRMIAGRMGQTGKSSRELNQILTKCCVLQNPKSFEIQPIATNKVLRKGSSFGAGDSSPFEPQLAARMSTPVDLTAGNKGSPATVPNKTTPNTNLIRGVRSSSIGKRDVQKVKGSFSSSAHSNKGNFSQMVHSQTTQGHREAEKKAKFSLKNMLTFGFSKKSTGEKREDDLFFCGCNQEKQFKNIPKDFVPGCVRSVEWLRNKYMPIVAHSELKATFEARMAEGVVTQTIKDHIQKDVVRTFSGHKYLSQDSVRARLERLLACIALMYPQVGYVQGMNFIAATLLYHCDEYCSLGVIKILFEQLELKDMFLPKLRGLDRHTEVIDTLLHLGLIEVWTLLHKYKVTTQFWCTDWLMCLGFNMIPPENSGRFLDLLLVYGWHYYYRMIVYYLKHLEPKILQCRSQESLLELFAEMKAGRKASQLDNPKQKINWTELIEEALYFSIDDELIDKLNGNSQYRKQFKACPKRA